MTLVVTLEPCPMCAGARGRGRVGRLVFGAADPKAGACGSLYNLCADPRLNHELAVTAGVLAERVGRPAGRLLRSPQVTSARSGGVRERPNRTVSKTVVAARSPWVQIPLPPLSGV